MDFTIEKYMRLLKSLIDAKYTFQTFEDFLMDPEKRVVILRHDVDLLPQNSLYFAKIQHQMGIQGTYYFRAVPESWDKEIILEISELGHEIGYHYETMDIAKGNIELAMEQFLYHLNELRKLVEVHTICMHGSPRSKFDNKDLWKKYHYKDYGIIGEPYFDIDFEEVFYLTDTGRRWNGQNTSVRDKVDTSFKEKFQSTDDIITSVQKGHFPGKVMFTFHPQRWHDNKLYWVRELIYQNFKNVIKQKFYVKS